MQNNATSSLNLSVQPKTKLGRMKFIMSVMLFLGSLGVYAQHVPQVSDKISKDSSRSEYVLNMNLDTPLTSAELTNLQQWQTNNASLFSFESNGNSLVFRFKQDGSDANVFLKAFMMVNIADVKLSSGSILTVDQYLSQNNF
jgi:hypothetical protein